jgi:hypothetical protein
MSLRRNRSIRTCQFLPVVWMVWSPVINSRDISHHDPLVSYISPGFSHMTRIVGFLCTSMLGFGPIRSDFRLQFAPRSFLTSIKRDCMSWFDQIKGVNYQRCGTKEQGEGKTISLTRKVLRVFGQRLNELRSHRECVFVQARLGDWRFRQGIREMKWAEHKTAKGTLERWARGNSTDNRTGHRRTKTFVDDNSNHGKTRGKIKADKR